MRLVTRTLMRPRMRAIIFDMDGTLNIPNIDFAEMRRRAGLAPPHPGGDILREIQQLDPLLIPGALQAVVDVETEACVTSELQPGLEILLAFLKERSIPGGIITRNSKESLNSFVTRLTDIPFDAEALISRDEPFEPKPHPEAAQFLLTRWGVAPAEAIFVGDSHHDIECGVNSGMKTVLLRNPKNLHLEPTADYCIDSLEEILHRFDFG